MQFGEHRAGAGSASLAAGVEFGEQVREGAGAGIQRGEEQGTQPVSVGFAASGVDRRARDRRQGQTVAPDRVGEPGGPFHGQGTAAGFAPPDREQDQQVVGAGRYVDAVAVQRVRPAEHAAGAGVGDRGAQPLAPVRRPGIQQNHSGQQAAPRTGRAGPHGHRIGGNAGGAQLGVADHAVRNGVPKLGEIGFHAAMVRHGRATGKALVIELWTTRSPVDSRRGTTPRTPAATA
ncbi:MAG TPA: hypothetical protein VFV67_18045 [Actinophytocola sp.]|uniref:hypothetical protein n=1 Tax=Actinophytocola sp. TaxID=1872138 RepID=UPI002DB6CDA8|nr:hypothetical protein [Actinophytocola sp.]HEU5472553.1 hypothetical protein [Actinophytocola sp.]